MSPYISRTGHLLLVTILILFVGGCASWEFVKFFTRPDIVTFSKRDATEIDPVSVDVTVYCSNPPNCGDILIFQNFSSIAASSSSSSLYPKCANLGEAKTMTVAAIDSGKLSTATKTFSIPLCYTGEPIYQVNTANSLKGVIAGVVVEMSRINPGETDPNLKAFGVVQVSFKGQTLRTVTLDAWQIKSLVLNQNLIEEYGELKSQTPFAEATQYEGKRPNWKANLLIQSTRFVDAEVTVQTTNMQFIWVITGSCGLVFQYWLLSSVLTFVLRRIFPGPAQQIEDEWHKQQDAQVADRTKQFDASDVLYSQESGHISYKVMDE